MNWLFYALVLKGQVISRAVMVIKKVTKLVPAILLKQGFLCFPHYKDSVGMTGLCISSRSKSARDFQWWIRLGAAIPAMTLHQSKDTLT